MPQRNRAAGTGSQRTWLGGLLLVAATLIAYSSVLPAGYIWDDDEYLIDNQLVQSDAGLSPIWFRVGATPQYYPLVFTSYWVEHRIWGLWLPGFHATNILLHAANALVLWRILKRLGVPAAGFCAAIFALHPVHVESVAWITERKNVLSGFFYLLSLNTYLGLKGIDAVTSDESTDQHSVAREWTLYGTSLLLFVAALLSKTVTSTLPAAILLLLAWQRQLDWRDVCRMFPFFAIGILLGMNTAWLEVHHVGAQGESFDLGFLQRCVLAGKVVWFYAFKLVWPAQLIFFYPRWDPAELSGWQWLFPATALCVPLLFWVLRHRFGWGPLVAVLFFGGTLFPALGFFDVAPMRFSFVADHFQYLASIGLIVLLGASFSLIVRRLAAEAAPRPTRERRHSQVPQAASRLVLLSALAMLTWTYGWAFADAETLYRDVIAKNPTSYIAQNNLASLLFNAGRFQEAIPHYDATLAAKPGDQIARVGRAMALIQQGYVEPAAKELSDVIEGLVDFTAIPPDWTDADKAGRTLFVQAYTWRGIAWLKLGQAEKSVHDCTQAARAVSDLALTYLTRANAYATLGQMPLAIDDYGQALQLQPATPELVFYNRATAYARMNQLEQAVADYSQAIRLRPTYLQAHTGRAAAYLLQGQTERALRDARQVETLGGTLPEELRRRLAEAGEG